MRKKLIILVGLFLIALFCGFGTAAVQEINSTNPWGMDFVPDDIGPFDGPIGADSPLYGLKVAMEDLDETFTFNGTRRVEKQVDHAQLRIAEVRRELELNRTDSAERVLELYWQKLNLTERSLTLFGSNETGLLHAQEMITLHQTVLANLLLSHPDTSGLSRAYNNSLSLGQRFEQKTAMKFTVFKEKDNKAISKAERPDPREQTHEGQNSITPVETIGTDRNEDREKIKNQMDTINATTTPKPGNREEQGKKDVNEKSSGQ
ncbi:MAG: DUF5667 domain-containing protein [Methanoregula sp.]|jgi:hypothetical protein